MCSEELHSYIIVAHPHMFAAVGRPERARCTLVSVPLEMIVCFLHHFSNDSRIEHKLDGILKQSC